MFFRVEKRKIGIKLKQPDLDSQAELLSQKLNFKVFQKAPRFLEDILYIITFKVKFISFLYINLYPLIGIWIELRLLNSFLMF